MAGRGRRAFRIEDLPPNLRAQAERQLGRIEEDAKRTKYRNERVQTHEGEVFDSKLEMRVIQAARGIFPIVLRQVSVTCSDVRFEGKRIVRLRPDALVGFAGEGGIIARAAFIDAKGKLTRDWDLKRQMLFERTGWNVFLIRRIEDLEKLRRELEDSL